MVASPEKGGQKQNKIKVPIEPSPAKITALLTRGADPVRTNPTYKNWHSRINKSFYGRIRPAKSFCKLVKSEIYPLINFKQRHNAKYKTDSILDTLTYVAMTNDFANNGAKTFRLTNGNRETPHPDTVLYHLRKLNPEEILAQFEGIFDKIYKMARKRRKFMNKVDLAVDFTDWLYYGNKSDPMVLGTQPRKGSHLAYKFATISVVEKNQRFTLLALPVDNYSEMVNIVERLLTYAERKVKIRRVYLDRWFYQVRVVKMLKWHGVKFIIRTPEKKSIKRIIAEGRETPIVVDYRIRSMRVWPPPAFEDVRLFIVNSCRNKDEKACFVTNLDVNKGNANRLAELFRKRWGIETSYRVEGMFRAKTTSKNYGIRLFYFMFSVCLYNLWILANIFMQAMFGRVREKPMVTAKLFGTLLYMAPFDHG